jgi:hypothetical protein
VSAKLQTVHVRVNDAATGEPTPCRVQFTGGWDIFGAPEEYGKYFAPFGRLTDFATGIGEDVGGNLREPGAEKWAYIDGTCEIALPPGAIWLTVSKGFEYRQIRQQIELKPGQASIRLNLERWHDARKGGWYSGDLHVEYVSPHTALLEAAAEDVAVVNLLAKAAYRLASDVPPRFAVPNLDAFSGQQPVLERPGHIVVVNTLNWHAKLGEVILLNSHRVVHPLAFGEPFGLDNWTLADWCDQCHRKGGLVVSDGFDGLAELILGKVDAFKATLETDDSGFLTDRYNELLHLGYRVPLVTGSRKCSNARPLGGFRTYARLQPGQDITYKNWIEAVRAGRTFITNGPLLYLTVNGQDPGSIIEMEKPGEKIRVHVEAHSSVPIKRLAVSGSGVESHIVELQDSPQHTVADVELRVESSGWLGAACYGGKRCALTSKIYINVKSCSLEPLDDRDAASMVQELDKRLSWVQTRARFDNDDQRDRLAGIFLAAKEELARRAKALG